VDERRQDRAGRLAGGNLRRATFPICRRFIGSSNVVKGLALDDSHLSCAGGKLRCSGGKLAAGSEGAIAIRQHLVRLSAEQARQHGEACCRGRWRGRFFLGASRDYLVEVPGGTQLRVVAFRPPSALCRAPVWLYLRRSAAWS